jgi:hypothetical protein
MFAALAGAVALAAPAPPFVHIADRPGFPAPQRGAVVFSRQLGDDALALDVVARPGRVVVHSSVIGEQGQGVPGLPVSFTVQNTTKRGTACGPGCYWTTLPVHGRPSSITLRITGTKAPVRWRAALPASWPAHDATDLVRRAGAVWRALRSLSFHERLASSAKLVTHSTWQIQAPNRVAYQVRGGYAGVIIGARRWDRTPGGTHWVATDQTPLTQPVQAWVGVVDAHLLRSVTSHGRPAWRISFFDPGTPAWFEIVVDKRTLHTLDSRMVTTAHFMHDIYGAFDATPPIVAPR